MSTEKQENTFDWSYKAHEIWYESRTEANRNLAEEEAKLSFFKRTQLINFLINIAIALAFILGFIGFIVFPQILIPGLALTRCLIASQVLSGFGILATLIKAGYSIYEMGWKETLRMLVWSPRYHFTWNTAQTILLMLGLLAIAIVIILSATGTIYIPFLTVFAANALSLEILEILWGLVSDIACISIAVMACYLFSYIGEPADKQHGRGRIEFSDNLDEQDQNQVTEQNVSENELKEDLNIPFSINPLHNSNTKENDDSDIEKSNSDQEESEEIFDDDFVKKENQWYPCNLL